jgi:hypothetical protein
MRYRQVPGALRRTRFACGQPSYVEVVIGRFTAEITEQLTAARVRMANVAKAGFTQAGTRS